MRVAAFVLILFATALLGQQTSPTVDEVRSLQTKFQTERRQLADKGIAKRFSPGFLERADQIAERAGKALAENRLLQASEAFHQARWQLPYQSPQVPAEHVARVLGNLRLRHVAEVNVVAFTPDGSKLATGSRDRTVRIWDLGSGREILGLPDHGDSVRAIAFSPDGKTIASAGGDKEVRLWNANDGKELRVLKDEGTFVTSLTFSPDGKYLVAGFDDKAVRIFETATGSMKRSATDFRAMVSHVSFNKDGTILATGGGDGVVRLWEFSKMIENPTHPPYWEQHDPNGATYQVAFSPDNKHLARCGADGVKIYVLVMPGTPFQATAPKRIITPPDPAAQFSCAIYSKDGKTILTGGADGLVRLWNIDTGQSAGVFKGHNGEVKSLALNGAGNILASASADHTIRLWHFDVTSQSRDLAGHTGAVWACAFAADKLVSASADRTAKLWDLRAGKVVHDLLGHKSGITSVACSADGKWIATASGDSTVKIWDVTAGATLVHTLEGHSATVTAVAISSDGTRIASGGADKRIRSWELSSGKSLFDLPADSVVTAIGFSPDGKQIASGHADHSIRLWSASDGKQHRSWTGHAGALAGLAFHPGGQLLATCGADHLVRIWSLADEAAKPISLKGHMGPVSSVAFHKDGRLLASGGSDKVVKLWKLEGSSATEQQNYRGHRDWITGVAFSRDGFYLASSSVDRTIKLWEITSKEIPLEAEHTGAVETVAVSPDGKIIASGATDRTIKLWDRATGAEIRTLQGHTAEVIALAFTPDGGTLLSASVDRTVKLWDVATGTDRDKVANFAGFVTAVPLVAVPPDGKKILMWLPGNERTSTIKTFDFQGKEVLSFDDDRHNVAAAFQASGRHVALANKDGVIRIFDLDSKGRTTPGGDWAVYDKEKGMGDLALTPDGKTLIAGSGQGEVRILDVAKRTLVHSMRAHTHKVSAIIVSPNGKKFASVGFENVVKVWDTGTGKELRSWNMNTPPQEISPFVVTLAFTPDGKQLVTANGNSSLYILDVP